MEIESKHIQRLYIAYFARPADPSGIKYWLDNASKGYQLQDISKSFACQPEYKKLITSQESIDLQINQFYINLFGRRADFETINFWISMIDKGTHNINDFICDLI